LTENRNDIIEPGIFSLEENRRVQVEVLDRASKNSISGSVRISILPMGTDAVKECEEL
jgi:hypothetical protein